MTTGVELNILRRAATKIGMPVEEYIRRRADGWRHCPACRRWLGPNDYGSQSRCRRCVRGHGDCDHHVYLDDRTSCMDILLARVRTRAEAEEMVRGLNRAALAGMPGVSAARVPLYYCVSEGVGDDD
jgi:hypothetical protein